MSAQPQSFGQAPDEKPIPHRHAGCDDEIKWNAMDLRRRVLEKLYEFWLSAPGPNHFIDLGTVSDAVVPPGKRAQVTDEQQVLLTGVFQSLQADGFLECVSGPAQADSAPLAAMRITPQGIQHLRTTTHTTAPNALIVGDASECQVTDGPHYVILVHGIRDNGQWQEDISEFLKSQNFILRTVEWNPISALWFGAPFPFSLMLNFYVHSIYEKYQEIISEVRSKATASLGSEPVDAAPKKVQEALSHTKISFVAHSFGAWAVSRCLIQYLDVNAYRVILAGSVARRDIKWEHAHLGGSAEGGDTKSEPPHVLNYCGLKDPWPQRARWLNPAYGDSGLSGFTDTSKTHTRYTTGRHSDALSTALAKCWVNFLRGTPATSITSRPMERKKPGFSGSHTFVLNLLAAVVSYAWQSSLVWLVLACVCLFARYSWLSLPLGICCPREPCTICDVEVRNNGPKLADATRSIVTGNGLERDYSSRLTKIAAGSRTQLASPDRVKLDIINQRNSDVVVLFRDISLPDSRKDENANANWVSLPIGAGKTLFDQGLTLLMKPEPVDGGAAKAFTGEFVIVVVDCGTCEVLGNKIGDTHQVFRLLPTEDRSPVSQTDEPRQFKGVLRILSRQEINNSLLDLKEPM